MNEAARDRRRAGTFFHSSPSTQGKKRKGRVVFMKKSLLCLFLVMAMVLAMVPAFAEGAEEPYTITYLASRGETSDKISVLMDILAMYQEEHPNFNIEVESIGDRMAYLQKVKILASSNELPDWFDADPESFFASLVDAGYIADMDATVAIMAFEKP